MLYTRNANADDNTMLSYRTVYASYADNMPPLEIMHNKKIRHFGTQVDITGLLLNSLMFA